MLGFAAVNTGNNLLYLMVSALLGFMAISGLIGQRNLLRLKVQLLPDADLYARLPTQVTVVIENRRRWLSAFLISIEIGSDKTLVPLLAAGQRQRVALPLTARRRGYYQFPEIWVRSCFPVNFFVRGLRLQAPHPVLVYPQPLSARPAAGAQGRATSRQQELPQQGLDGEVRSIDEYSSKDPLKSIHWKLSARHDELKVRRHNRLGAPSLLLDIDDFNGPLEERLSQCTFLVDQAIRSGRAVGLRLGDELFAPAGGAQQRIKLLRKLALYDQH